MTYRDAKTLTARGQVQLRLAKRAAKALATFQCLIVSTDERRGEMFRMAASDGGWRARVCENGDAALAQVERSLVQLAIVDLEGQSVQTYRPCLAVCRRLAVRC
jgi:DNA-binding response OmpR family regulator